MRERFIRRCSAHLTALFERAEGYRIQVDDGDIFQSRESGLWCPRQLPGNKAFGHWATRWLVCDETTGEIVARASAEKPAHGNAVELDETFFGPMIEVLEAGESAFARLLTPEDEVCPEPVETLKAMVHLTPMEPPHLGRNGLTAAPMSMSDAHVAIIKAAGQLELTPVEEEALRILGECSAIAWCPRERKRPYKPHGVQLELCWADPMNTADEWAEMA